MKYFNYLSDFQKECIFYKQPASLTKYSSKEQLEYALGATLYMPATRQDIAQLLISNKYKELCSVVLCLEDSIGDTEVHLAEKLVVDHISAIHTAIESKMTIMEDLPLIFIRVRSAAQIQLLAKQLGDSIELLTGFVFPKFSTENAGAYLDTLESTSQEHHVKLYGMPILETPDLLYKETRMSQLTKLKEMLSQHKESILNVRIGATDLCGLYGIRRNCHTTIYDISIIRDLISDIINFFGRDFVISGPVWEYFDGASRILKPQLRQTPFKDMNGEEGLKVRAQLLNEYTDGLIKETLLDLSNGLTGKTVIHPTHLKVVQSLNVISKEEYLDALHILENANGEIGVMKSSFANKMNEIKPHEKWATKMMLKSEIYGVYNEGFNFIDLLADSAITAHSQ